MSNTSRKHLLSVALGPVQDFIAQARRSRDLWFGSHILSELSRAGARVLAERDAKLVFPALQKGHIELQPTDEPLRNGQPALAIPNKLLALVDSTNDLPRLARSVREAIRVRWRAVVSEVLLQPNKARHLIDPDILGWFEGSIDNVATEQMEHLLEIYIAWTPIDSGLPDGFARARDTVEGMLAARKTLRDFRQQDKQRPGAPKSSLDGGRASILRQGKRRHADYLREAARFRIPNTENLDVVGLVKRCGGAAEQFTPIANVALAEWIEHARKNERVSERLDALGRDRVARKFGTIAPGRRASLGLSVDAQCLIESRLPSLFEEINPGQPPVETSTIEGFARDYCRYIVKAKVGDEQIGDPHPYVGVIVADGDHMGALIDAAAKQGELAETRLRDISSALAEFAGLAREILEENLGSLIYAGGDDVLAFVPLGKGTQCATALAEHFAECMTPVAVELKMEKPPSLSVGLGIGHLLEGMGDLLDLGREAEKAAKGADLRAGETRNALAIVADKRSGGRNRWRCRWDKPGLSVGQQVADAQARLKNGRLSLTRLQQIRRDLSRMPSLTAVPAADSQTWARVLSLDVLRTLNRLDGGGTEHLAFSAFGLPNVLGNTYAECLTCIDDWVQLHLIAKELNAGAYGSESEDGGCK